MAYPLPSMARSMADEYRRHPASLRFPPLRRGYNHVRSVTSRWTSTPQSYGGSASTVWMEWTVSADTRSGWPPVDSYHLDRWYAIDSGVLPEDEDGPHLMTEQEQDDYEEALVEDALAEFDAQSQRVREDFNETRDEAEAEYARLERRLIEDLQPYEVIKVYERMAEINEEVASANARAHAQLEDIADEARGAREEVRRQVMAKVDADREEHDQIVAGLAHGLLGEMSAWLTSWIGADCECTDYDFS